MYSTKDYIRRGAKFANNVTRPSHKKLSTLMIYATDYCDSECKHCLIWTKRPVKHLPFQKIVEVMNSKCVDKNTVVGLEGGEFLLHPQANKILDWFKNNHPNFDLLSNCLKPDNVIRAVQKYPPKRLYLSLDGDKETYHYMRGKDGYDSVIKVIEACKDIVPISLMFTLSPYNDFDDLEHVIKVCHKYDIDVRVGVYNDIEFFNTVEKAHETDIAKVKEESQLQTTLSKSEMADKGTEKQEVLNQLEKENLSDAKHDAYKAKFTQSFKELIPESIRETSENFDFLLLYDEWRKKHTKLKCYSILDSAVIHPNGNVPICQNLELKLGNIHTHTLDEIFNSAATRELHKEYVHNCNQCWINFHRKYDIVMMRSLEKYLPKRIIELVYGKYQWSDDSKQTYKQFMNQHK